jgi:hypothetical protein
MKISRKHLWLILIPLMAFGIHEHYISLTKIKYVEEKKSVQITMSYFIDDIEKVLENRSELPMELATKSEHKKSGYYLESYVRQKFKVSIDEKQQTYTYLGKEYENDLVYIYLEIENVDQINKIEVQNSMLMEEFAEQQNYIKLSVSGVQRTFILIKANDKEMLKL